MLSRETRNEKRETALEISGSALSLEDLRDVVYAHRSVTLSSEARHAVDRARAVVDQKVAHNETAYAITTGVGKLSDVHIPPEQIRELQVNLMRSHAVGVGEPLSEAETRAMMLLRANSLAKGHSGVRPAIIDFLCEMLNRGVHPVIPSQGSVGASGDLAPLAHLGLVLIGEGEAIVKGERISGAESLKRAKLQPLTLEAKEAVSLINGTQGMLALGTLALLASEVLVDSADVISAMTLDALHGTDVAFDPRIHRARPHPGQIATAENLTRLLAGSQIRESHRECGRVQDAYSLRCIPQVHGAVRDTLAWCRKVFEIEMNSAVDNPLVFAARERPGRWGWRASGIGEILSGGNFHGEPIAFALDYLAIVLTALSGISERRIERLVNPALNEGLPPFLAPGAGLNSGFMMPQVTAAALVAENRRVIASGIGRIDHYQRQQRGFCFDGNDVGSEAEAHSAEHDVRGCDRSSSRSAGARFSGTAQDQCTIAACPCGRSRSLRDAGARPVPRGRFCARGTGDRVGTHRRGDEVAEATSDPVNSDDSRIVESTN